MFVETSFSDSALAAWARDSRLPSRELATGLCFHASVELARQALRRHSPVALAGAGRRMAGAAATLVAGYLLEASIRRLGRLLLRLN